MITEPYTFRFDPMTRTVIVPAGRADEGDTVRVLRTDRSVVEVVLGPFIGYASAPIAGFSTPNTPCSPSSLRAGGGCSAPR